MNELSLLQNDDDDDDDERVHVLAVAEKIK